MPHAIAFRLNPDLDPDALADTLAERGRVQIRSVLTEDCAEALERCMTHEVPWSFTYYDGRPGAIDHGDLEKIPAQEMIAIQRKVLGIASTGFSYAYGMYHADAATRRDSADSLLLRRFFEFLGGPEVMTLIRAVLRDDSVAEVDAQATRFGPGNFLSYHNDLMPNANRRCAYVFNLTRAWRPDWGGYLQFFEPGGNGSDAFLPAFNVLNLFKVPQPHAVTYVPPFAAGYRYAVSGWYRASAADATK